MQEARRNTQKGKHLNMNANESCFRKRRKEGMEGGSPNLPEGRAGKEREEKKKQPAKIQKRIHAGCKDWCRHLPIFPGRFQPSILGASGLNCRVRDGNGCTPTAIGTDSMETPYGDPILKALYTLRTEQRVVKKCLVSNPKRSSSRFCALGQALGLLVLPS